MKKLLIIACGLSLIFAACKKDPEVVSRVVDVSAPSIVVKGDKFMTIAVNGAFTDPGATLTDDVTGAVSTIFADTPYDFDASVPGMYTFTYSALNANGYGTTVARYVAVTDYADNANLAGTYKRASNSVLVNVTRKSRGLYAIADFGGANIKTDIGYFAVLDPATMDFGNQYSETVGPFTVDVKYFHMTPADTGWGYVLHASGYGTAQRNFSKQP